MLKLPLILPFVFLAGCATNQQVPFCPAWSEHRDYLSNQVVVFALRKSTLTPEAKRVVSEVATYMTAHGTDAVRVEGRADDLNTEEANRELGERRAQALAEELAHLGMDTNRVDTISYGEDNYPLGRQIKNKRCSEFVVLTPPL